MPRRLSLALAGLALTPLLGFAGCDDTPMACTLIGCTSAYVVTLASPGDAVPAGRYTVTVAAEGEARSCAFTVAPCADGTCVSDPSPGCPPSVYAVQNGAEVQIRFEPLEGPVSLTVALDGVVLSATSLTPAYEPQYPNGIDCGAVCEVARTEVAVE